MTHGVNARVAHVTRPCKSREADTHVAYVTMFLRTICVADQDEVQMTCIARPSELNMT
jgi:hypothetical protein